LLLEVAAAAKSVAAAEVLADYFKALQQSALTLTLWL
jgi:hypothetical protein